MLLLGGGVVLKLAKILPDFLAGFVLFVKPLEGVDVTLQVELGRGKVLLVGSVVARIVLHGLFFNVY